MTAGAATNRAGDTPFSHDGQRAAKRRAAKFARLLDTEVSFHGVDIRRCLHTASTCGWLQSEWTLHIVVLGHVTYRDCSVLPKAAG